jgi:DEAD_2
VWYPPQGSRPHYCINKSVLRTGAVDAECDRLLREGAGGCRFKKNAALVGHSTAQARTGCGVQATVRVAFVGIWMGSSFSGLVSPSSCQAIHLVLVHNTPAADNCCNAMASSCWISSAPPLRCGVQVHDIEDLCKIGQRYKACPYFASRNLADTAELVFCPYNYLLDPSIRRASKARTPTSPAASCWQAASAACGANPPLLVFRQIHMHAHMRQHNATPPIPAADMRSRCHPDI